MKLHLVHDQSGKIVAAVRLDEDRPKSDRPGQRSLALSQSLALPPLF